MARILLLGDSIFDNAAYVKRGLDVCSQLQDRLGPDHHAALIAQDGSVLGDMAQQIEQVLTLKQRPDQLFVSCGGNDVLELVAAMQAPVGTLLEGVELLASWQAAFRSDYCAMLELLEHSDIPYAVSTIYDAVPGLSAGLRTALAPFNDVIVQEAGRRSVPVLDLRFVCREPGDFSSASPIEPSETGGGKIAAAIGAIVLTPADPSTYCALYTGHGR